MIFLYDQFEIFMFCTILYNIIQNNGTKTYAYDQSTKGFNTTSKERKKNKNTKLPEYTNNVIYLQIKLYCAVLYLSKHISDIFKWQWNKREE